MNDHKPSKGELEAYDNLRLVQETNDWKIFEEKGTGRIWARRKESLTNYTPDIEEPEKKKSKFRRKTFNL